MIVHFEVTGAQTALAVEIIWEQLKYLIGIGVEVLRIAIWPLLLVFILNKFYPQILEMLNRLSGMKFPGGAEATFSPPQSTNSPQSYTDVPDDSLSINEAINEFAGHACTTKEVLASVYEGLSKVIANHQPKISLGDQIKVALNAIAALQIQIAHERNYRLLFGSQIKLIRQSLGKNVDLMLARQIYNEAYSKFPGFYVDQGYTFDQWLQFILGTELLLKNNNSLIATNFGSSFLAYLAKHNLREDKLL